MRTKAAKHTYKKTGLDWMPEVPEHWRMARLKYVTSCKKGKVPKVYSDDSSNFPYLSMEFLRGKAEVIQYVLPQNDLILVDDNQTLILWDGANAGEVLKSIKGYLSSTMAIVQPDPYWYQEDYFFYLLKGTEKILKKLSTGTTIPHLDSNFLFNSRLPVPPKDEQEEIVQYIKAKEEKINLFIQKKQQFIELLKEQKSAIAKANFLSTNKNWRRRKISQSFKIIGSGTTPESGNSDYYDNGEINWINTGDLNDGYLDKCDKKITKLAFEKYSTLKIYPKGTLLIALYGATIGKVAIMNIEGCTNQACCAMYGSDTFHTEFLFHWFIANREVLIQMSYGGGQPNISQEIIRQLRISCPPPEEQKQIVEHIKTETATIDTAIAKAEREIELIREYKEAMISEAVMGGNSG